MNLLYFIIIILHTAYPIYLETNELLLNKYNIANNPPFYSSKYLYSNHYSFTLRNVSYNLTKKFS